MTKKQNGVDVWPNAAIWMRDELRSKVRSIAISCTAFSLNTYSFEFLKRIARKLFWGLRY